MRPGQRERLTRFQAGLIALLVLAVGTYFAFAKDIPFTKPYELKAMFDNAASLQLQLAGADRRRGGRARCRRSRRAGDDSTATVVTMKIDDEALPIHRNARAEDPAADLPRGQLLRGPQARHARRPASWTPASTIPSTQTAAPVQLDQVLGTLKTDARKDLQKLLQGSARRFGGEPEPDEDADRGSRHPRRDGRRVAERLARGLARGAARHRDRERGAARAAARGDLRRLIKGTQKVSAALAQPREPAQGPDHQLQHHHRRAGRRAGQPARARSRVLPRGARGRPTRRFDKLNASFPSLRAFSLRADPGRARDPGHDRRRRCRGSPRRARSSRPRELGGLVERPAARRPRPGHVHRRLRAVPARRPTWSTAACSTTCCPPATW